MLSINNQSLDTSASNSEVISLYKISNYSEYETQLAAMEGAFAFYIIIHSQSFCSMDCTTKLLKKFHSAKFSCAMTKCEAIIKSGFKIYCDKILTVGLEVTAFVTNLCNASDHYETKLYLALLR